MTEKRRKKAAQNPKKILHTHQHTQTLTPTQTFAHTHKRLVHNRFECSCSDLFEIDLLVNFLVHLPNNSNVVASQNVQTEGNCLHALVLMVDSLSTILHNNVSKLIETL
eukprot:GDKI01025031.1.p1 GENE.GDKI01025031.1~~GDKI01025031.1.p1  ORF type:complete len:126 (+),score=25.96 GDKI01025031.1:52-378(+)